MIDLYSITSKVQEKSMGSDMSKQKLKKIKVRLRDINICPPESPHYAEWRVKGVWQKWIGREELKKIADRETVKPLRAMLLRPLPREK